MPLWRRMHATYVIHTNAAHCYFRHPRDAPARPTAERLRGFSHEDPERERILPGGAA